MIELGLEPILWVGGVLLVLKALVLVLGIEA